MAYPVGPTRVERDDTRPAHEPHEEQDRPTDWTPILLGIIAVGVLVVVGFLGYQWMREQHGYGDIMCHAKYGDPGWGNVWMRYSTDNVCRTIGW